MITLQLSKEAFKRFQAGAAKEPKPPKPFRLTSPALTERQVAEQIWQWLSWRGWSVFRQQSGLFRRVESEARVRVGQRGCSDWYAVRESRNPIAPGLAQFLFYEVKRPGKRPDPHQLEWLEARRRDGLLAEWFDSLDSFVRWYASYGFE